MFVNNFFRVISCMCCCIFYIHNVLGQTMTPLCASNVYDIEDLKEATFWRAPYPGGCYDSYGDETAPCDFYFSFCKSLPASLVGTGGIIAGAMQNETKNSPVILGGISTIEDGSSGTQLVVAFNDGAEVECGKLNGILMILNCDPNVTWALLEDGSGVVPTPIEVELYNTTDACSYKMTVRYNGACTKIEPSQPIINQPLSAGSILIIIVLVTSTIYLVGGVLINCSGGATGVELIPNLEFWKSLPGLIAEGAMFFWSCMTLQSSAPEKTGYESI